MIIITSIVIRWINILLYDYIVDAPSIPFDCIEFIRNIVAEILLMSEKYGTLLSHHYRVVCNIIVATKRWLCLWKLKINIIIITQLDWCEFAVILFGEAMQKSATGVN